MKIEKYDEYFKRLKHVADDFHTLFCQVDSCASVFSSEDVIDEDYEDFEYAAGYIMSDLEEVQHEFTILCDEIFSVINVIREESK